MAIRLNINGRSIEAEAGTTLLQAAQSAEIYIPALCAHPDLTAQKNCPSVPAIFHGPARIAHDPAAEGPPGCGMCLVDVEGEGRVAACATPVRDGMAVTATSPALTALRRGKLAAILAHHPHACLTCAMREGCTREPCSMNVPVRERCCTLFGNCELQALAEYVGIDPSTPRYVAGDDVRSSADPLFDRDPALCIACGRCVRACDSRDVHALGWVRDTSGRRFVGPIAPTLTASDCRLCGSCVEVCPTGALMDRSLKPGNRDDALVPCRAACPAGTDVPRYVRLVAERRFEEAAAVVAERAPLVEVLGQVCFHPCEAACRRNEVNLAPISICAVKREAGAASAAGWAARFPQPLAATGRRAAVVGAGPAGLMAAHTLRILGHSVTVFEAGPAIGGMLNAGIPPFRLSRLVAERETRALLDGAELRLNSPIGPGGTPFEEIRGTCDAIVVATGGGPGARLGVSGEQLRGVHQGLDLLAALASGSMVPGAFERQAVVVIGGGNVAIDCARTALRLGADRVDVVCLEQAAEMPAFPHEVEAARAEQVQFHHGWGIRSLTGRGRLEQVELKRCARVFDGAGRFSPVYDDAEHSALAADTAIVAIGQRADRALLPPSLDGVFLAGDLATGPRSVVEALRSGREAALAADRYLGGRGELSMRLSSETGSAVLGRSAGFAARPRLEPVSTHKGTSLGVSDSVPGLGADRAAAEADRCLRCDLRLEYREPRRPPSGRARHVLEAVSVDSVPENEGVIRYFDHEGDIVGIVGTANLRQEVAGTIGAARATHFEFETSPMYTQRQNELLAQFVEAHGRMPSGPGGNDDVDDLF
jgi:formate dehydrogenase beta subunit